jgi:UDP-N-acetyl-D-mannosaminuronate dehydrogenase
MTEKNNIVIVGLGEVGKPLYDLASKYHSVLGVDIKPPSNTPVGVDVLHICYPFQIRDFVGECARYVDLFRPKLTVINSTVAVGTTRKVAERTGGAVTYSPVRGKHTRMLEELVKYRKFIGALDPVSGEQAARHFQSLGMKTKTLSSPEAAELAKLTETTYFGLMIAWAQEVERYADQTGANYDEIVSFYEEIAFFPPVKYTSGVIGGHCVMPNIELLRTMDDSQILNAIKSSNSKKVAREASVLKPVDVSK